VEIVKAASRRRAAAMHRLAGIDRQAVWYGDGWSDAETKGTMVHEPEEPDTATGILDAQGYMIHRVPEPIGFRLRRDDE
jgi:hypothetical protein